MLYNLDVIKFYDAYNKYTMSRFMRYDPVNEMYDILDSKFIKRLSSIPIKGIRTVTTEVGKPSLLCENIYGYFQHQYWWILMEVNDLISPEDLVNGLQIKYPDKSALDRIFGTLSPRKN